MYIHLNAVLHPGLRHAERSWIHPQKQDPLSALTVLLHVAAVGVPGVLQRVINVPDRLAEGQPTQVDVQLQFSLQESGGGAHVDLRYRFDVKPLLLLTTGRLLPISTSELFIRRCLVIRHFFNTMRIE